LFFSDSCHKAHDKMKILVTGAAGFIGQIVSKELLSDDSNKIVMTDIVQPPIPHGSAYPHNAETIQTDLIEAPASIIHKDLDAAILLHGVMSSAAEADFELGYRVNVDATRALLLALAKACTGIRVLYASSEAVYGTPVPKLGVTEADIPTPEMSYGCQKIICETLINDFTRRGMINGFSLRFPTISIRPGAPSAAISAFLSGIIREPLNGQVCTVPLIDRAWRHWMCSPKTLVYNIMVAVKLPRDALPLHRRSVNLPGFAVTVQEMLDALEEVAGKEKLALVKEVDVPDLKSTLYSWADDFDNSLGLELGMKQDKSFVQSVQDYVETISEESKK
jgi:nucleoside-diphosphate-sugar epimerase